MKKLAVVLLMAFGVLQTFSGVQSSNSLASLPLPQLAGASDAASKLEEAKRDATNVLHAVAHSDMMPGESSPSQEILTLLKNGVADIMAQTELNEVTNKKDYWLNLINLQLSVELQSVKTEYKKKVNDAAGSSPSATVIVRRDQALQDIDDANNKRKVVDIWERADEDIQAIQLTEAKTAAVAAVETAAGTNPSSLITGMVLQAKAEINGATTVTAVNAARDKWVAKITAERIKDYQKSAIEALLPLAGETPWTDNMTRTVANATNAVMQATSVDEVANEYEKGKQRINALYASELNDEKTQAQKAIENEAREEPWTSEMAGVVGNATNAVWAADSKTAVRGAQVDGVAKVRAQYSHELGAAKDAADRQIETAAGEQPWTAAMTNLVNSIWDLIEIATTKAGVSSVLTKGLTDIAALYAEELAAEKKSSIDALIELAGPEPWSDALAEAVASATNAINAATTKQGVRTAYEAGYAVIEELRGTDVLYPAGDGPFAASSRHEWYVGVMLDSKGAVQGSVEALITRASGISGKCNIHVIIRTLDRYTCVFREYSVPTLGSDGTFAITPRNWYGRVLGTLILKVGGDSMTGTFAANYAQSIPEALEYRVDAVRNVFRYRYESKASAINPYLGYWTIAANIDGLGTGTISVRVLANGRVKIIGQMAGYRWLTYSTIAEVGDNWIGIPVMFIRNIAGAKRAQFGMRVALYMKDGVPSAKITNVNTWTLRGRSNGLYYCRAGVDFVAGGHPILSKRASQIYALYVPGYVFPTSRSYAHNTSNGFVYGALAWRYTSTWGRTVIERATYTAIDVSGQLYGTAVIRSTAEAKSIAVDDSVL